MEKKMGSINYRRCSGTQSLSKGALLNLIKPRFLFDEEQLLQIIFQSGYPDGGSFSLWIDPNNYTDNIQYYSENYEHTAKLIRRALSVYRQTTVSSQDALNFRIKFTENNSGINYPQLVVKSNNLTLGGVPAGRIKITTITDGNTEQSLYKLLRSIPEQNWTITSFEPSNKTVCVEVNTTGGISRFTTTFNQM
jgi:hypothetical protein